MSAHPHPHPRARLRFSPAWLYLGVGLLALLVHGLTALPLQSAGYFDAYYYMHVAQNMVAGRGMVEAVVWNYLDQSPVALQLPHPSHLYWMPLTSWLAWAGLACCEGALGTMRAAMLPFVLLSSLLPPLSSWMAWHLWQRRDYALAAGLLTIFSGFYFLYWVVPDSYTPFALAVALALLGAWSGERGEWWGWALAGVGAGLAHLTRADGALLVPVIALLVARPRNVRHFLHAGMLSGTGYLLVMGPWFARNYALTGTILPGGGTKTIWLRSYDELFSYGIPLTAERFFAWGLWPIVRSKAQGLLWNSVVLLGALQFFLAPFAWLGWRASRQTATAALLRPFALYAGLLFAVMTLVFTFPARRGSLLHSAAALIPWVSALIPAGIARAAHAFARWRGFDGAEATRVLGGGFVALAALISLLIYAQGVLLPPAENAILPRWNERSAHYATVGSWLTARGATGPIIVVDPPSFYALTGRHALAAPSDSLKSLGQVADRFEARWLVVERDHAAPYSRAWSEAVAPPGWTHRADFTDPLGQTVRLFERVPR